jgi:hypothetical protein
VLQQVDQMDNQTTEQQKPDKAVDGKRQEYPLPRREDLLESNERGKCATDEVQITIGECIRICFCMELAKCCESNN